MAAATRSVLIETVTALGGGGVAMAVSAACSLLGVPRSTYYRLARGYRHYRPVTEPIPQALRVQPAALTSTEREAVVSVLVDPEYVNLSVVQAYWVAFDAGRVGCSQRTFYRIAACVNLVGDRRRRKTGGTGTSRPRAAPVVVADAVGDLWSWDVSELRGPRNQRYKLYLAIDVFSRHPVAWRIEHVEDQKLAVDMFTTAVALHDAPKVLHADNGAVMRSRALIDALTDRGVLTSYSRPRVSDDNPFSESLFKTIKYDLDCPERFADIDHARIWTAEFLGRYTHQHRHSGLGRYTPHAVHTGRADEIRRRRQHTLDSYYQHHPHRFRRPPTAPALPGPTGINTRLSQTG